MSQTATEFAALLAGFGYSPEDVARGVRSQIPYARDADIERGIDIWHEREGKLDEAVAAEELAAREAEHDLSRSMHRREPPSPPKHR